MSCRAPRAGAPVSYFVRAKDAAGNQSANSNTVARRAPPPTQFENVSLVRSGGHFCGNQTFPAL